MSFFGRGVRVSDELTTGYYLVMHQPIVLRCPARLVHGICDDAVPWQTSLAVGERLESRNVVVILLKYGERRLSS